jgi:hypothetical protein
MGASLGHSGGWRSLAGGDKGQTGYFTAAAAMACGARWCVHAGRGELPFVGMGEAEGVHGHYLEVRARYLRRDASWLMRTVIADGISGCGVRPECRRTATHSEERVPRGVSLGRRAGRDDGASGARPTGWGTRTPRGGWRYAGCRVA